MINLSMLVILAWRYRRSGEAFRTPIWFVRDHDPFYLYPAPNAVQGRRISRYPHVRIMPCTPRGKPQGQWVQAEAYVVDPDSDTDSRAQFLYASTRQPTWRDRLPWRRHSERLVMVVRIVS